MLNQYIKILTIVVVTTAIGACGGSGSGSTTTGSIDNNSSTSQVIGAVSGISYVSPSYSGTTGVDGSFQYAPGEDVSFSVGALQLGTVSNIGDYVSFGSPVDLENQVDPYAMNLVRMFMALDSDGDPSNGITLLPEAANLASFDITDEAAMSSALSALDPSLQLPTQQEAVTAYDAALFSVLDKNTQVASYETITSYLVPAVAPATNIACQIYTSATFEITKDATDQSVYSGVLYDGVNRVESFSFSGSFSGYTDLGASVKMWNMTDESLLLSINGEAHLSNTAITGNECRQQIRLKKAGQVNNAPVLSTRTSIDGIDGCTTQANLNILYGGTTLGTPYSVTTYVVAYDIDGTLDSVVIEPSIDAVAQTSVDLTQTLGSNSTTNTSTNLCGASGLYMVTNYSWDDSVTPIPHVIGCYTQQVACNQGFSSTITVTDSDGALVSDAGDTIAAPDTSTDTSAPNDGTYTFGNGASGNISGVFPYYSGTGFNAYTDDTFYSLGISANFNLAVNESRTGADTISINEFIDTNGDGVVTGADGLNSLAYGAVGTMTLTNMGSYYVYQFTGTSTNAAAFSVNLTINVVP